MDFSPIYDRLPVKVYLNKVFKMVLFWKRWSVLPAVYIRYEMNGREISLDESVIPEEKETLEAARDVIKHFFREFRKRRFQDPIEIWIRGNHPDYSFEVRVCCRRRNQQVERVFEELKKTLSRVQK